MLRGAGQQLPLNVIPKELEHAIRNAKAVSGGCRAEDYVKHIESAHLRLLFIQLAELFQRVYGLTPFIYLRLLLIRKAPAHRVQDCNRG